MNERSLLPRLGIQLGERELVRRYKIAVGVEDEKSRTCSALVDGADERFTRSFNVGRRHIPAREKDIRIIVWWVCTPWFRGREKREMVMCHKFYASFMRLETNYRNQEDLFSIVHTGKER